MGRPQNKILEPFPIVLNKTDFGIVANVTLLAGQYTRLGTYTVGAGQEATFGINTQRGGGLEGEPIYLNLHDGSANIDGTVRFILSNSVGTRTKTLLQLRTERLRASQNDRTLAFLLPEYNVNAKEDSKLLIDVQVDSSSNVTVDFDGATTILAIPVTIYQ